MMLPTSFKQKSMIM